MHFGGTSQRTQRFLDLHIKSLITSHLSPHSHGGPEHLLHHQHLLHLLSGGDRGSSTERIPLVPALRVPGPEALRADRAPGRGAGIQGPGPHCRCALHREAPQRHPQPVQATASPQGQELWWSFPGDSTFIIIIIIIIVIIFIIIALKCTDITDTVKDQSERGKITISVILLIYIQWNIHIEMAIYIFSCCHQMYNSSFPFHCRTFF